MGGKNAAEVFSSPEAGGALTGAATGAVTGFMVGGPVGAVAGAGIGAVVGGVGAHEGAKAAKEDKEAAAKAVEDAKKLQSTVENTGTSATTGTGTTESVSQTTFAPKSALEQNLTDASVANFQRAQDLATTAESQIAARGGTQTAARDSLGNILGGSAFDLTANEQDRINQLRSSDIAVGSEAVNSLLNERLGEVSADAARRGVRGQAFSQLQGDAIGEAAKSLERRTLAANQVAAGQALSMPGQRVGIQASTAGQFANFQDLASQQAFQNRQALQDPVALQQALDERLKSGKTAQSGSSTSSQTGTSTDTRVGTGEGAVGVLQAGVGLPGARAGGIAGALGAVGAVTQAVGAGAQMKSAMNSAPAEKAPA